MLLELYEIYNEEEYEVEPAYIEPIVTPEEAAEIDALFGNEGE